MNFRKIFVTVGTTQFDDLIEKLNKPEMYDVFKNHLWCTKLKLQIGRGKKIEFKDFEDIQVEFFDLKESIYQDIEEADLVSVII